MADLERRYTIGWHEACAQSLFNSHLFSGDSPDRTERGAIRDQSSEASRSMAWSNLRHRAIDGSFGMYVRSTGVRSSTHPFDSLSLCAATNSVMSITSSSSRLP